MKTPEQEARELLDAMGLWLDLSDLGHQVLHAPRMMSAGELAPLANLIADKRQAERERDEARALLARVLPLLELHYQHAPILAEVAALVGKGEG